MLPSMFSVATVLPLFLITALTDDLANFTDADFEARKNFEAFG